MGEWMIGRRQFKDSIGPQHSILFHTRVRERNCSHFVFRLLVFSSAFCAHRHQYPKNAVSETFRTCMFFLIFALTPEIARAFPPTFKKFWRLICEFEYFTVFSMSSCSTGASELLRLDQRSLHLVQRGTERGSIRACRRLSVGVFAVDCALRGCPVLFVYAKLGQS